MLTDSFNDVKSGIYESLITEVIQDSLSKIETHYNVEKQNLDPADAAIYLSRFLQNLLHWILETCPKGNDKVVQQVKISNALIYWLRDYLKTEEITENLIVAKGELLKSLYSTTNPIAANLKEYVAKITPLTGLTQSELFTGSNVGLSLETELKREILSSDEIWWLVSFIKWTGVRIFADELKMLTDSGKKLKVITTSYMGATDQKAVNFLGSLRNTEIKLSYNISQERLHAKAYMFLRNSGFDTGYIGSSNMSRSALTNGLEWNLKVTTKEIPHIIKKFKSTFETYWASSDFESYHPENEIAQERLKTSLAEARGEIREYPVLFFDLTPHPYQEQILERLSVERSVHNRWRNLVVAATGTGKTLISAFDYQRFKREKVSAKLLYVAHRQEILIQARITFQAVLRDSTFGELWVGNEKPSHYEHLFVSVQTLNNQIGNLDLTSDFYDVVIIDEVHHIAAVSYRPILKRFSPKILLGLTATPERHDGTSILDDFCGTIAAELRLPDAITRRYLCPFQYFGINDSVDLSSVEWKHGRYLPSELTHLYTNDNTRVKHILRNMNEILGDIHSIKCLAFCVSQDHAEYMKQKFLLEKIKTDVLTSENGTERSVLRQKLKSGEINVLFVVDIFNEGVDIPEIDTVLFLRPTESLTVFLQQLGRGLRLNDGKECLTVLDFVGNARPEYDFSSKFRGMVGRSQMSIVDEIENNFPHAPLGCSIILQKQAKETILNNIKRAFVNQRRLISWIRGFAQHTNAPLTLNNFLNQYPSVSLEDVYKTKINGGGGWTRLCIKSGAIHDSLDTSTEKAMFRGISNRILQCTSFSYLMFLLDLFDKKGEWERTDDVQNQWALMAHYDFWQVPGKECGFSSLTESLKAITNEIILNKEILSVLECAMDRIENKEIKMNISTPSALHIHARYSRDEILASFGVHTFNIKSSNREGVVDIQNLNTELLFVTLQKTEKRFSPTTLYHDYAINKELFHWQSQNSARPDRGKGLKYINHKKSGKTIILFVREQSIDEFGRTMGFVNLGPVYIESYNGSQPMNITWKLEQPLPSYLWREAVKLAVG
jgi:superfamily II DNA or RNA helicase